ncbi:hypothetical protein QBC46DRAFT_336486 [Diplogelasinospora grovesii]|uniref:Uncharacterized protein n=1 Tax=Diplogelasinospora grovesii TaxID=303347 RepID=A0AAN6NLB0_9PEZI|nr:hypothetical protein QBC46DRAFT_336486 [Diplogelasinospora grovesii]
MMHKILIFESELKSFDDNWLILIDNFITQHTSTLQVWVLTVDEGLVLFIVAIEIIINSAVVQRAHRNNMRLFRDLARIAPDHIEAILVLAVLTICIFFFPVIFRALMN